MDKNVVGTAINSAIDVLTGIPDPVRGDQIQALADAVDSAGGVGALADHVGNPLVAPK